jgi:hypothetical protein
VRVVTGLAIAALALSVVSIWGMVQGLRELRREQAGLGEELRALRASDPRVAALGKGRPGRIASSAAASAQERGAAPLVTERIRPGEAGGVDSGEARLGTESPTEVEDATSAREALLAQLEENSARPSKDVLDRLALFAQIGREEAREALMEALGDPDPEVRKRAVEALAELGDDDAVDGISELARDPDPEVRKALAKELGSSGNPTAAPVLLTMLHDESPSVVEEALKSFGDLHYQPARRDIEAFTRDENLEVAGAAGRALRALGDDEGAARTIDYLSRFLDSDEAGVRSTALSQIGKIGGESAIELLERALDDPDPKIRGKAHWYLAELQ